MEILKFNYIKFKYFLLTLLISAIIILVYCTTITRYSFFSFKLKQDDLTTHERIFPIIQYNEQYPYHNNFTFDEILKKIPYSKLQSFIKPQLIKKVISPHILIDKFVINKSYILPIFNPSIIRIDNITNYYKFMSHSLHSSQNIEIIKQTHYILLGRIRQTQCERAGYSFVQYPYKYWNDTQQSKIILFDTNWNIISYVDLFSNITHKLEDCRLFIYLAHIFVDCLEYIEHIAHNYFGALYWKEEMINNELKLIAYLDSTKGNVLKQKELKYNTTMPEFENPKNLLPLVFNNTLYFQWNIQYSYFIQVDLVKSKNNDRYIYADYAFDDNQSKYFDGNIIDFTYHQSWGFLHLPESNEFLGVGHKHYDLHKTVFNLTRDQRPTKYGSHYTHFFFTIQDNPPFKIKKMSDEFCFVSPYVDIDSCDIVQFVNGVIQTNIDGVEYLFISYGVNDCISAVTPVNLSSVIQSLRNIDISEMAN